MSDPLGELEELIARAFAEGPTTMDAKAAAEYLAVQLAPKVVLRDQLEHVGWLQPEINQITTELSALNTTSLRAVFCIPARTVQGTSRIEIPGGMAGVANG